MPDTAPSPLGGEFFAREHDSGLSTHLRLLCFLLFPTEWLRSNRVSHQLNPPAAQCRGKGINCPGGAQGGLAVDREYSGVIPGGLARRIKGNVDQSVER